MSFLNRKYADLVPYTPGEQVDDTEFIKLNTNESPFEPAPAVKQAAVAAAVNLNRYCDTSCQSVIKPLAKHFQVKENQIFLGNGSDEVLAYLFQAFTEDGVAFPDITYGFYQIYANYYQTPATIIPLNEDFSIDLTAYDDLTGAVIITNPNAPTGIFLATAELVAFAKRNPERLLIVDEAYVDFGAESMTQFVDQLPNLLVIGTFSKSRQMAGARLGYAVGNSELIADLNKLKFSTNPYNINSMTQAVAAAVLSEPVYVAEKIQTIIDNRTETKAALEKLGFEVTDSYGNFLFAKHPNISGEVLLNQLKARKIFVRWFNQPRTKDYLRISIGTTEQMAALMTACKDILKEVA